MLGFNNKILRYNQKWFSRALSDSFRLERTRRILVNLIIIQGEFQYEAE